MSTLRLTTFQSFQPTLDNRPIRFRSIKDQALLIYLAVEQGSHHPHGYPRAHSRSALAGLLWPDEPESRARRNLSSSLLNLRKAIGDHMRDHARAHTPDHIHKQVGPFISPYENQPPFLCVDSQSIAFNPASDHWLDRVEFRSLVESKTLFESRAAAEPVQAPISSHPRAGTIHHGQHGPHHGATLAGANLAAYAAQLQQAVDLYHGPFLDDFVIESDLFEEWRQAQQAQLSQQAQDAFTKLSASYAAQGQLDQALHITRRQLAHAPWREETHGALMQLLAQSGQRSAALAQYDTLTQMLMDDLGVGPAPETDLLYDQIVAGEIVDSWMVDSGIVDSGIVDSEIANSGIVNSRMVNSAIVDSGMVNSGMVNSGMVNSGMVNSAIVDSDTSIYPTSTSDPALHIQLELAPEPVAHAGATPRLSEGTYPRRRGQTASTHAQFVVGPPITQPHLFFGRKMELSRIFGWWQQSPMAHVTLIGPRRSGKTSLLRHLQAIASAQPPILRPGQKRDWLPNPANYRWVWVDFQDPRMRSQSRLLEHLLTGFGIDASGIDASGARVPGIDASGTSASGIRQPRSICTLETFMDAAYNHHWDEPVIVLMDELETGLAAPELEQSFWWALRALTQATNGHLAFALSANDSPARLAEEQGKTSPFFNIFTSLELGPLTSDEATELMESSSIPFAPDEMAWILAQSQGWPILLQTLCQERLSALMRGDKGNGWKTTASGRLEPFRYLLSI